MVCRDGAELGLLLAFWPSGRRFSPCARLVCATSTGRCTCGDERRIAASRRVEFTGGGSSLGGGVFPARAARSGSTSELRGLHGPPWRNDSLAPSLIVGSSSISHSPSWIHFGGLQADSGWRARPGLEGWIPWL